VRQRDSVSGERVFRTGARPTPPEVSAFIDELRACFGVEPIWREFEVSASAYRVRRRRRPSGQAARDAELLGEIRRVHAEAFEVYGQWKMWQRLEREGIRVARCTVERWMGEHGIEGVCKGKTRRTTIPGLAPAPADDRVRRNLPLVAPTSCGWLTSPTSARRKGGVPSLLLSTCTCSELWLEAGEAHASAAGQRRVRDGARRPPGTREWIRRHTWRHGCNWNWPSPTSLPGTTPSGCIAHSTGVRHWESSRSTISSRRQPGQTWHPPNSAYVECGTAHLAVMVTACAGILHLGIGRGLALPLRVAEAWSNSAATLRQLSADTETGGNAWISPYPCSVSTM